MSDRSTEQIRELLDSLYRLESGRILATLIRLLGDFDLAEEAMHEAFTVALSVWPTSGVPGNPRPWLISTARFKAIDTLHSARADMCRRLGRTAEARASYEKALALTQQEPERQFLQERIRQLKKIRVAVDFRSPQRLSDERTMSYGSVKLTGNESSETDDRNQGDKVNATVPGL